MTEQSVTDRQATYRGFEYRITTIPEIETVGYIKIGDTWSREIVADPCTEIQDDIKSRIESMINQLLDDEPAQATGPDLDYPIDDWPEIDPIPPYNPQPDPTPNPYPGVDPEPIKPPWKGPWYSDRVDNTF